MTKGKKGFMAWKIDLSKAYDRVSWRFIMDVLKEMYESGKAWELIYKCISIVSYKVIMMVNCLIVFCRKVALDKGTCSPLIFL